MPNLPTTASNFAKSLRAIGDRNEIAWHIIDFGLMHDPDYADIVAMAAAGPGEHSKRLSAMVASPDEQVDELNPSMPVAPPLPATAYRFRPMSEQEQMKANPFYRGRS